jgi:hypothetical protein
MKKKSLVALICLVGIALFTVQAQAWEWSQNNLKLKSIMVTSAGVEFTVKTKRAVAPNSSCVNEFVVPNSHADFNLMAAFLLTASAGKKKISISFDEASEECQVEVNSVVLY